MKELLEMSMKEFASLLANLNNSVPAHDSAQVAADAHQLKGMSATMTMSQVADLAYKLEMAAKKGDWTNTQAFLDEIGSSFAAIEKFLQAV